jgi:hypothetical protein
MAVEVVIVYFKMPFYRLSGNPRFTSFSEVGPVEVRIVYPMN